LREVSYWDRYLFIYLFILHSMHAAIKAMTVNKQIVKDVNTWKKQKPYNKW